MEEKGPHPDRNRDGCSTSNGEGLLGFFALTTNIIGAVSGISVATIFLSSLDGASKTAPAIDPAKPFDLYMLRRKMGRISIITYESSHRGLSSDFFDSAVWKGICSGTTLQLMEGFILSALS